MSTATRRVLTVMTSVLAFLSVAAAVAVLTSSLYDGRVLPRTTVAGVSLANKSYPQAAQTIQEVNARLAAQPITLTLDDKEATFSAEEIGVTLSPTVTQSELPTTQGSWDWLTPTYWQRFFSAKELGVSYDVNEEKFNAAVDGKLAVSELAKDATINVTDGQLTVDPAVPGHDVDVTAFKTAFGQFLLGRQMTAIPLVYQTVQPQISTEEATQTKTDIERTIHPLTLKAPNATFAVSTADLYSLITYSAANNQLNWKIDDGKLAAYLAQKVSKKLDVKMVQKVVQSNDGAVVSEGKDGLATDVTGLKKDILAAISSGATAPIAVVVNTVAFTTKTVDPLFATDLFDGVYIDVNLKVQKLAVIQDHSVTASYLISSGKPGTPTPVGQYYILNKSSWAQSRLFPGIFMEKWNALTTTKGSAAGYNGYGLHRVPWLTINGVLVRESLAHLGKPISHGCVRIEDAGADWVYDNAPIGTPVHIHY